MTKERRAILEMFLCALMWSFASLLIKLLPWHTMVISALRSLLAAMVLFVYMRIVKIPVRFSKKSILLGVVVACIFLLYLPAVKMTSSANAVALQYSAPIHVLILSAIFNRQHISRMDILAAILTVAGIALFFFDQLSGGSMPGNILALISGMFLAGMFFINGRLSEAERLNGLLLAQIISVVIGVPFLFTTSVPVSAQSVLYILLLGVVQLGLPYILYVRAGRYCSALHCSLIAVVEPLMSPVWILLVTGERPSLYALLGSLVVLATITLHSVWGERNKAKQAVADEDAVLQQANS